MLTSLPAEAAEILGLDISPAQLAQFETYASLLLEWNEKINLTAIRDPEGVRIRHFLDSLSCFKVMQQTPMARVIDVGTGAGFPGLVFKIMHPAMQLTLVESVKKKADFCQVVVDALGLEDVTILPVRAEEAGQMDEHREAYDWSVARALARMDTLVEYLLPLARVGGFVLAPKGEAAVEETETAGNAIRILGGRVKEIIPVSLPGESNPHSIILLEKTKPTPLKYPRHTGTPKKNPL